MGRGGSGRGRARVGSGRGRARVGSGQEQAPDRTEREQRWPGREPGRLGTRAGASMGSG